MRRGPQEEPDESVVAPLTCRQETRNVVCPQETLVDGDRCFAAVRRRRPGLRLSLEALRLSVKSVLMGYDQECGRGGGAARDKAPRGPSFLVPHPLSGGDLVRPRPGRLVLGHAL